MLYLCMLRRKLLQESSFDMTSAWTSILVGYTSNIDLILAMLHIVRKTELDILFICIVSLRLASKWATRLFAVVLLVMVSLHILILSSPVKLMLCFVPSNKKAVLSLFSFNKFNFIQALMSLIQHSSLSRHCLSIPGTVGLNSK